MVAVPIQVAQAQRPTGSDWWAFLRLVGRDSPPIRLLTNRTTHATVWSMSQVLPRIVRQVSVFTDRETDAQIQAQIAATKALALDNARRIGINRPVIHEHYDIYVVNIFTDYPMYLTGPNAPKIETYQDALVHGNGLGQYQVLIREDES